MAVKKIEIKNTLAAVCAAIVLSIGCCQYQPAIAGNTAQPVIKTFSKFSSAAGSIKANGPHDTLVIPTMAVNEGPWVDARAFPGGDCGAKINAADAWLGANPGEIWVNQACGTNWTTPVALSVNHSLKIVQPGTYTVAVGNTFAGNNIISGLGDSTLLMAATQTGVGGSLSNTLGGTFYVNGNNVRFKDIALDGNLSTQGSTRIKGIVIPAGIQHTIVDHVTFTNWSFEDIQAWGTDASPVNDLQITDSHFDACGYDCVQLNDTDGFIFTGNTVSNWGSLGMTYGNGISYELTNTRHRLTISNNRFITNSTTGYAFSQGPYHPLFAYQGCVVSGNTFDNETSGHAGVGFECDNADITDNVFLNGAAGGIWRSGMEVYGSDLKISDNNVQNALILVGVKGSGYPASRVKVQNNTITNGGSQTGGNASNCFMIGGTASGTYDAMDQVDVSRNSCDISGITAGAAAISLPFAQVVTNLTIDNNTVIGNTTYAKGISATGPTAGSSGWRISNNRLRSLHDALYMANGTNIADLTYQYNDVIGTTNPTTISIGNPTTFRKCGTITSATQTDLGGGCGANSTDLADFSAGTGLVRNPTDATAFFRIQAGATADQVRTIQFLDHTGASKGTIQLDNGNDLILTNGSGAERLIAVPSDYVSLNGQSTGGVRFNSRSNSGTGGVGFYSGSSSPALVGAVDSVGRYTGNSYSGKVTALTPGTTVALDASTGGVFTLTPAQTCTINVTNATAGQTFDIAVLTSGTSSYTITFGTNFKSTGTLATGTSDAKYFNVSFVCTSTTNCIERSRTTAQ